jgi:pimeloyl-ACP methyl ester carboxylesterase
VERSVALPDDCRLHVEVDDFTDPWIRPETVLLVHGLAESSAAWYAWVPTLGRELRVLRPDLRGYGRSTPMRRDFLWTLDILADDLARVIEELAGEPVHVVGAKIGATVSVRLAARHPALIKSLTLVGLPVKGSSKRPGLDPESHGVRAWARSSMEERLGSAAPEAMLEYWSDLMGRTAQSTLLGFSRSAESFDVSSDLERLRCRVLAITSNSPRHPISDSESWRTKIASSELFVAPGEGYHAAAVYPDLCARATLKFIGRSRLPPI